MRRSSLPTSPLLIPSRPPKSAHGATGAKKKLGKALVVKEAEAKMAAVKLSCLSSKKTAPQGHRNPPADDPESPEDQATEIMILHGEYGVQLTCAHKK